VQSVALGLMLQYAGVRAAELRFVESLSRNIFSSKKLKTENYNTKFSAKSKNQKMYCIF
jgi:hypothetical protein